MTHQKTTSGFRFNALARATAVLLMLSLLPGCVRDEIVPGTPMVYETDGDAKPPVNATSEGPGASTGADQSPSGNKSTGSTSTTPTESATTSTTKPSEELKFAPLKAKVKFKRGDGSTGYSFKPADDGAKLVDGSEKELARFNVKAARLKVKRADDSEAGNIRISSGRLKIEDSQGEKLFELQRQDDGDWKLDDKDERLVYKIKRREYGFEVEDDADNSLYKVKLKDGKLSIRNPGDETVLSTKTPFPPLAAACLMLEKIKEPSLRYGVAAAIALEVDGIKP